MFQDCNTVRVAFCQRAAPGIYLLCVQWGNSSFLGPQQWRWSFKPYPGPSSSGHCSWPGLSDCVVDPLQYPLLDMTHCFPVDQPSTGTGKRRASRIHPHIASMAYSSESPSFSSDRFNEWDQEKGGKRGTSNTSRKYPKRLQMSLALPHQKSHLESRLCPET